MVQRYQVIYGKVVGDDHTLESPLMAQHVIEEVPVSVRGDSIHLVVGRHEAGSVGLLNGGLERFEEVFANDTLRVIAWRNVGAAFGLAMHGEVFSRGHDVRLVDGRAVTLKPRDGGHPEAGRRVRFPAVIFFRAPPARSGSQVEYRSEALLGAA